MTVEEMIRKYRMALTTQNGEPAVMVRNVPKNKAAADALKKQVMPLKPQIIAELQRQEAEAAAEALRREAEEQTQIDGLKNGSILFKPRYRDGEYLQGYTVTLLEEKLLREIELGSEVRGWGWYINPIEIIKLGTEFTYEQAKEYTRPEREKKEREKAEKAATRQALFDKAKKTGQPVKIRSWHTDCGTPGEDCSMDIHTEWAMPDGSVKHEWQHTW